MSSKHQTPVRSGAGSSSKHQSPARSSSAKHGSPSAKTSAKTAPISRPGTAGSAALDGAGAAAPAQEGSPRRRAAPNLPALTLPGSAPAGHGSPRNPAGSPRARRDSGSPRAGMGSPGAPYSPLNKKGGNNENVRVLVRVRPFSAKEVELASEGTRSGGHTRSVIDMPRGDQVQLLDHLNKYKPKQAYSFDTVLWSVSDDQQESPIGFSDQDDVYQETGAVALDAAWEGINSCIFAYGQTGSGKTHTMMGDPAQIAGEEGCADDELGVIPRLCRQLFSETDERREQVEVTGINKSIEVETVFIEIYNESVHDLLVSPPEHIKYFTRERILSKPSPRDRPRRPSLGASGRDDSPQRASSPRRRGSRSGDALALSSSVKSPLLSTPGARTLGGGTPATTNLEMDKGPRDRYDRDIPDAPRPGLKIREHPTEGPQVEGVTVCQPQSYRDVMDIINWGNQQRHVACTKMNDRSSRSHAMFRICLRQLSRLEVKRAGIGGPKVTTSERRANLNLVDLAGSENVKRSGASGSTMLEAQKINLSLTTLRRVIDALIDRSPGNTIPYRESALTWLLRQDLGGNSKCFMLATVSPHVSNAHESQRTLDYAMRARSITNMVNVNEDDTAKMFSDLEKRLWENQQRLLTEQATAEEKDDLEKQCQEIMEAKIELKKRIEEQLRKATEQQQLEEKERKRRVKQRYLWGARRVIQQNQLDAKEREIKRQEEELDRLREQANLAGYGIDDIDTLASSLKEKQVLRDSLDRDVNEAAQQWEAIQHRTKEQQGFQAQEISELSARLSVLQASQGELRSARGASIATHRSTQQEKQSEARRLYDEHQRTAEARRQEQLRLVREAHSDEVTRYESDFAERFSDAARQLQGQQVAARDGARNEREEHLRLLRKVQESEDSLRADCSAARLKLVSDRAEAKLARTTEHDNVPKIEQKLSQEEAAATEKQGLLEAVQGQERLEREQGERELDELRAANAARALAAVQDELQAQAVAQRLYDQERVYQKTCSRANELFRFLDSRTDNIANPERWTAADAPRIVSEFAAWRRKVNSVKPRSCVPNDKSQQILPTRSGGSLRLSWTPSTAKRDSVTSCAANGAPPSARPPVAPVPPVKSKGGGRLRSLSPYRIAPGAQPSATQSSTRAPYTAQSTIRTSTARSDSARRAVRQASGSGRPPLRDSSAGRRRRDGSAARRRPGYTSLRSSSTSHPALGYSPTREMPYARSGTYVAADRVPSVRPQAARAPPRRRFPSPPRPPGA